MRKIGRNDPCSCGSGKKYKQCCLKKRRIAQQSAAEASSDGAVEQALDWLHRKHRHAVARWIDEVWYGDLSEGDFEALQQQLEQSDMQQMHDTNMFEYMLADGRFRHEGRKQFVMDMVLGVGGVLMNPGQRQYLQQLRNRPLRLYEIRDVRPSEGVLLHDLMNADVSDAWVQERSGSRHARQWSVWGARIMERGDHLELSGAIYDIPLNALDDVVATLERMRVDPFIEHKDEMCALAIADHWMKLLATPFPMPQMVDAATGEAMVFITEHYRVNDWAMLARRLAAEDDVDGDQQQGWNRFSLWKMRCFVHWLRSTLVIKRIALTCLPAVLRKPICRSHGLTAWLEMRSCT